MASIVLKRVPKEVAAFLIRWSGLPFLVRNTFARNKVSIIQYHDPKPHVLERHLRYLARNYEFITLDRLVEARRSGDWSSLPRKSLVVTFDDGWRGNFELLGILEKYRVVPTIYLCSQIVCTSRHYWWTCDPRPEQLKTLPNSERIRFLEQKHGFREVREFGDAERQSLNSGEIERMRGSVCFGSHSRFHPILPTCSSDESKSEIFRSKSEVERIVGAACRHFSYPNGSYTEREVAFVEEGGYDSARTTDVGWNDENCDLYRLKMTGVPDDASINRVAAGLVGIARLKYLARRFVERDRRPIAGSTRVA